MIINERTVYVVMIFFFASIVLGCAGPQMPGADGKELYSYITTDNNYKNWNLWPGTTEKYNGTEPHGALLTTRVSDSALSAIQGKQGSIPAGGIIVKENYLADGTFDSITVMYKIEGFDSDNHDWFWAKYRPDGTIDVEGKAQGCINCHNLQHDNDYLYTAEIT